MAGDFLRDPSDELRFADAACIADTLDYVANAVRVPDTTHSSLREKLSFGTTGFSLDSTASDDAVNTRITIFDVTKGTNGSSTTYNFDLDPDGRWFYVKSPGLPPDDATTGITSFIDPKRQDAIWRHPSSVSENTDPLDALSGALELPGPNALKHIVTTQDIRELMELLVDPESSLAFYAKHGRMPAMTPPANIHTDDIATASDIANFHDLLQQYPYRPTARTYETRFKTRTAFGGTLALTVAAEFPAGDWQHVTADSSRLTDSRLIAGTCLRPWLAVLNTTIACLTIKPGKTPTITKNYNEHLPFPAVASTDDVREQLSVFAQYFNGEDDRYTRAEKIAKFTIFVI